jgi:hypothetical protein
LSSQPHKRRRAATNKQPRGKQLPPVISEFREVIKIPTSVFVEGAIFFFDKFGWNAVYFILLLVAVQVLHDVLFYVGVIRNVPQGSNDMMDTFKRYADDLGGQIIGGDALLVISSALIAMLYKMAPFHVTTSITALVTYALPFAIYTKNPFSIVVEEKKETTKEAFTDPKLDAYKRMVGL